MIAIGDFHGDMIKKCPKCATSFIPYLRGQINVNVDKYDYSVLICTVCKTIVGHETKADIKPAETAEDLEKELGYLPPSSPILSYIDKPPVKTKRMLDMEFEEFDL